MAEAWELDWQRLPLEGTVNTRELGGFPLIGGGQTRYHRFLRSDALVDTTPGDIEFLRNYGVRAVLDMRGAAEAADRPNAFLGSDVATARIAPYDVNLASTHLQGTIPATDIYDIFFENGEAWREIFEFIAGAPEGCVLFNCAVGKDRTGVLAALIMMLSGCDRYDVIASYMPSRINLMRLPFFRLYWDMDCSDMEREHYDSLPSTLEYWLRRLDDGFGGDLRAYLEWCGVSREVMEAVRLRLVG